MHARTQAARGLSHCPLFRHALEFLAHPEDRLLRTAARTVCLALYRGGWVGGCKGPGIADVIKLSQ